MVKRSQPKAVVLLILLEIDKEFHFFENTLVTYIRLSFVTKTTKLSHSNFSRLIFLLGSFTELRDKKKENMTESNRFK